MYSVDQVLTVVYIVTQLSVIKHKSIVLIEPLSDPNVRFISPARILCVHSFISNCKFTENIV